jgi:hypothetical protein
MGWYACQRVSGPRRRRVTRDDTRRGSLWDQPESGEATDLATVDAGLNNFEARDHRSEVPSEGLDAAGSVDAVLFAPGTPRAEDGIDRLLEGSPLVAVADER